MIHLKNILLEVFTGDFISKLKSWENSVKKGWDSNKKKWFPHASIEGGTPTIAYGHKLSTDADLKKFKNGITDPDAVELLKSDIDTAINKIKTQLNIPNFNSLPQNVQQALVNATFRGELKASHKTVDYMRRGNWSKVADEYLNNNEYRTGEAGVKKRMDWNAAQFRNYANSITPKVTLTNQDVIGVFPQTAISPSQEITIKLSPAKLPIDSVIMQIYDTTGRFIKKHRWNSVKQGILKFPAPTSPGVYHARLNNTATAKFQVQ
jgi:GH24 family phage-related lysozyme (muramidase)